MLLRSETQHGLCALMVLGQRPEPLALSALATEADLPRPMLAKVLQQLARAGLVDGRPGPGGGYRLSRAPSEISLIEIIRVWEGARFGTTCLLGLPGCGEGQECPFHQAWGRIRGDLMRTFEENTLQSMLDGKIGIPDFPI